eukprot:2783494-Rhodomonas_salina.2
MALGPVSALGACVDSMAGPGASWPCSPATKMCCACSTTAGSSPPPFLRRRRSPSNWARTPRRRESAPALGGGGGCWSMRQRLVLRCPSRRRAHATTL